MVSCGTSSYFWTEEEKLEVLVCNDFLKTFSFKSRQHKIWVMVTVKIFYVTIYFYLVQLVLHF